jgi:hypothetical protein
LDYSRDGFARELQNRCDMRAHPERLLSALDEELDEEIRLIIYGRSAVWLGFQNPPTAAATTQDVDAIIPRHEVQALSDNVGFGMRGMQ